MILLSSLLLLAGCTKTTPQEEEFPLGEVQFAFLQAANKLYFAVPAAPSYSGGSLTGVNLLWWGVDSSSSADTLGLNDQGTGGDIIAGDGLYSRKADNGSAALANPLSVSDTGRVYLAVRARYQGQTVQLAETFWLGNIRPRIISVQAPDSVARPASGLELVAVRCTVYDANGLDDIRWVGFRSYHTGLDSFMVRGEYILLYDDGDENYIWSNITSGDYRKGDGIYSLQAPLDSAATPGIYHWIFEAQDRAHDYSDTLIHRIVVP